MKTTNDEEKSESKRWRFDKNVPISLIIVMVVQFASLVWFVGKLDARIAALEAQNVTQHERDERQDKASSESDTLMRTDLKEINGKLDRLIERIR
jgi:hypothetical protein